MSKYNGGVKMKASSKERRKRVIERLEAQLTLGKKPFSIKNSQFEDKDVVFDNFGLPTALQLTSSDRTRIQKEIDTLKTRI